MLRTVVKTGAEPSAKGALLCALHGTSSLSSAGPTMRACAPRKSKDIAAVPSTVPAGNSPIRLYVCRQYAIRLLGGFVAFKHNQKRPPRK